MVLFVALLMVAMAGFLVSPALSGEHPWDSDKDDDGSGGGGSGNSDPLFIGDTIPVTDTTIFESETTSDDSAGLSTLWTSVLSGVWSSLLLM